MGEMFNGCSNFNGDVSKWDVSNVITMKGMFHDCSSFNGDVSKWDVSKVTNMRNMFKGCSSFNGDVNTHIVEHDYKSILDRDVKGPGLYTLFPEVLKYLRYTSWDVSNVTNMVDMFKGCSSLNADLSNWNVSHVQVSKMRGILCGCSSFILPNKISLTHDSILSLVSPDN